VSSPSLVAPRVRDHRAQPRALGAVPGALVFTAAALWILLRAEFLAIALVLVYVGAEWCCSCRGDDARSHHRAPRPAAGAPEPPQPLEVDVEHLTTNRNSTITARRRPHADRQELAPAVSTARGGEEREHRTAPSDGLRA